jgi:uncharacterized membrane protein YraQ (UPF0718 family)
MLNEILRIGQFIGNAFLHIWPYLVVTIPLAVLVKMSGASKYIERVFGSKPYVAILMATAVGAFSPFCSCGVIPIIASLLISGVPLAPVMSFWIASPSMDPEIFFLSVGTIGWELAVWRLAATLLLSLGAGFITQWLMDIGWLGHVILRSKKTAPARGIKDIVRDGWIRVKDKLTLVSPVRLAAVPVEADALGCEKCATPTIIPGSFLSPAEPRPKTSFSNDNVIGAPQNECGGSQKETFKTRLLKETAASTLMVAKFMTLAFFLEGLITLYIPAEWITTALGSGNSYAIVASALMGIPAYTTSLTALPMISGLLTQGMQPAAALAFLIAGPTTTLPAMAAVWPLVVRKVFFLYISFALLGAIIIGYAYEIIRFVN